eukprot:Gb_27209 [translate_table: standard]
MSYEYVDPSDLRFTQPTIASHFSPPYGEDPLPDVLAKMKRGLINTSVFEPLLVHTDKDGIMRCENNRRLWVLRKAGVPSIKVKIRRNDFLSRSQKDEDIARMNDPDFFPKIRGVSSNDSFILDDIAPGKEMMKCEENESSLPGILVSASAALIAGFASWKLFKSIRESEQ